MRCVPPPTHTAPCFALSLKSPRRGGQANAKKNTKRLLNKEVFAIRCLLLVNPDRPFVMRKDASDYAMGAVLEQTDEKGNHYPVAFWSRVLTPSQRKSWTPTTKEAYAIVSGPPQMGWPHRPAAGLPPTDHQSLRNWHTECVDTPSGPAARVARWHETFSKFDLSVVYVPGKDNTIADVLSRWVYPAGRTLQDVSVHGDAKETELAKQLIAFERQWEEQIIDPDVKCFVVQSKRAPTAHMIRSVVASVSLIARLSAPYAPPVFTADNDVLTQDWGPAYAKCPDFFDVITSAGRETTTRGQPMEEGTSMAPEWGWGRKRCTRRGW